MRDLKDLLEPLGDRPMPDRWDAIQHRPVHPMPEPHRSRLGAGITAAAIALLAIGVIVWLSPLRGTGREPESSTSPQPSHYVSPQGWTVPLPPGWTTKEFSLDEAGGAMQGTVIASQAVGSPTLNEFAIPVIHADQFPSNAVALVVGDLPDAASGGMQPVHPPLAYSDFVQAGSSGDSSLRALRFEGPRQLFFATTQVGADASATDLAALRATIAGLTFSDEAGTLPSPSGTPGLPSRDSVVDGRFVTDVVLDDGAFSVQPAPANTVPVISQADAQKLLLASPVFQGKSSGVLGFGLVTSQVSQHGVPTYQSDPAWIAFGWGGVTNCPMMTAAPPVTNLPSSGYVAVALIEGAGGGDISYEARTDACGSITGPTVQPATHIESVAWTQTGPVSGVSVPISYAPPACGAPASYSADGVGGTFTLTVEVEVPNATTSCSSPTVVVDTVDLSDGSTPVTSVEHGPTGIVRQAKF